MASAGGEAYLGMAEAVGDLFGELRDEEFPSTLTATLLRTILIINTYMRLRIVILVGLLAVGLIACGGGTAGDGPLVVATTSVLGDVVSEVTGDAATVEVLIPRGADPHDYELSSRQTALLEEADLVVAVGLELEEGMGGLLDDVAGEGTRVLRIGPLVEPDWIGDSLVLDPHVWMDPLRMALAGELVATELSVVDPGGPWEANAAANRSALEQLDAEITEILSVVPAERRLLVTGHDSLGYFADRYGFTVVGSVVPGGSTHAQPSSAHLSELIDLIREMGIPAIFGETTEPTAVLDAIAAEPGLELEVVRLHVGSLGEPGSGAGTYSEMLLTDARLIAEALG